MILEVAILNIRPGGSGDFERAFAKCGESNPPRGVIRMQQPATPFSPEKTFEQNSI